MKMTRTLLWAIVIQSMVIGSALAASFEGVEFPDTISVQSETLVLNGFGPRFATMAKIRVYVAGLYVRTQTSDAGELIRSEGPKQLLMKFQRDVSAEQSRDAWQKGLEKARKSYPNISDRLPQLMDAMSNMKKGEEMAYVFSGEQVEIVVRGESKAVIMGRDFIEALFTVWLKYPPNPEFAKGLLGK
jgi:hypothetical protein